jgi:hypothetical protein
MNLVKQSSVYLMLSLLIILYSHQMKLFFVYMNMLYAYINLLLQPLFGSGIMGEAFRNMSALVLIPLVLSGIPALIYWIIKRKKMPYFIELTWLFWLILALCSYLIH